MLDAIIPQGSIVSPTAAGAAVSQTAWPEATAAAATLPAAIPNDPSLRLKLDALTGASPPMFDDAGARSMPAAGTPSSYFLTPQLATPPPSSPT
jgi:hypothetical protein